MELWPRRAPDRVQRGSQYDGTAFAQGSGEGGDIGMARIVDREWCQQKKMSRISRAEQY